MNRIILYILSVFALTSCTSRTANNANGSDSSYQDSLYAELREREMQESLMRESYKYINSVKGHEEKDFITGRFVDNNIDTLYFLGHYIRCGEDSIYAEIERSFINDPNVSFDRQTGNIAICGTDFHVNPGRKSLVLMSPVQPETRGIRKVRNYISKFHGKENYEEPEHYSWLPFTDSTLIGKNYPVIHLRRIHSEEGGTTIIIQ